MTRNKQTNKAVFYKKMPLQIMEFIISSVNIVIIYLHLKYLFYTFLEQYIIMSIYIYV